MHSFSFVEGSLQEKVDGLLQFKISGFPFPKRMIFTESLTHELAEFPLQTT